MYRLKKFIVKENYILGRKYFYTIDLVNRCITTYKNNKKISNEYYDKNGILYYKNIGCDVLRQEIWYFEEGRDTRNGQKRKRQYNLVYTYIPNKKTRVEYIYL